MFLPEGSKADAEGREVERLLLRYNTSLKHVYARLQEGVHKESRMASLQVSLSLRLNGIFLYTCGILFHEE